MVKIMNDYEYICHTYYNEPDTDLAFDLIYATILCMSYEQINQCIRWCEEDGHSALKWLLQTQKATIERDEEQFGLL